MSYLNDEHEESQKPLNFRELAVDVPLGAIVPGTIGENAARNHVLGIIQRGLESGRRKDDSWQPIDRLVYGLHTMNFGFLETYFALNTSYDIIHSFRNECIDEGIANGLLYVGVRAAIYLSSRSKTKRLQERIKQTAKRLALGREAS